MSNDKQATLTAPDPAKLPDTLIKQPNKKQASARINKMKVASLKLRDQLWPGLENSQLWLREDKDTIKGFTTIPRTMPLLMNLINDASKQVTSGKAVPAGKAYLVLWCRVFDEGFLKIESEATAALEAGYAGERNVSTWREHMRVLKELGFIDYKPGPAGPCQYILLWNPHRVVRALRAKGWVQDLIYFAIYQRAIEVRATEFDADTEDVA